MPKSSLSYKQDAWGRKIRRLKDLNKGVIRQNQKCSLRRKLEVLLPGQKLAVLNKNGHKIGGIIQNIQNFSGKRFSYFEIPAGHIVERTA